MLMVIVDYKHKKAQWSEGLFSKLSLDSELSRDSQARHVASPAIDYEKQPHCYSLVAAIYLGTKEQKISSFALRWQQKRHRTYLEYSI